MIKALCERLVITVAGMTSLYVSQFLKAASGNEDKTTG